jgi:hypothetical protein
MACGCELRGAPARQNSIYLPGVYASLAGLRGLGVAAEGTPPANAELERDLTSLRGQDRLVAALRAAGVPEATISQVAVARTVIDGAASVLGLLTTAVSDEGTKTALRWFRFLLTGSNPPGMSDNDVRVLADICQGTNFFENDDNVIDITTAVAGGIRAFFGADAAQKATDLITVLIAFLRVFRSRLCASTRIVRELQSRTAGSADDAAITAEANRVANAAVAAARAAPTPQSIATMNVRRALVARATAESLGPTITSIPWGSRRYTRAEFDCLTSNMLSVASQAFVSMLPGTPLPVMGRFRIPSPRGYINTPPAASCQASSGPLPGLLPADGGGGGGGGGASSSEFTPPTGGGGGGGGAGIAIAGAGLLAALMFFRR